jgi:hypothetical protein
LYGHFVAYTTQNFAGQHATRHMSTEARQTTTDLRQGPSALGLDDFNVICGFAERSSERLFAHGALLRCLRRAAFARLLYPGPAAENEVNGAAAHALTV